MGKTLLIVGGLAALAWFLWSRRAAAGGGGKATAKRAPTPTTATGRAPAPGAPRPTAPTPSRPAPTINATTTPTWLAPTPSNVGGTLTDDEMQDIYDPGSREDSYRGGQVGGDPRMSVAPAVQPTINAPRVNDYVEQLERRSVTDFGQGTDPISPIYDSAAPTASAPPPEPWVGGPPPAEVQPDWAAPPPAYAPWEDWGAGEYGSSYTPTYVDTSSKEHTWTSAEDSYQGASSF